MKRLWVILFLIVSCTPPLTPNIDSLANTNIRTKDKGDEILFYDSISNRRYRIKKGYKKIPVMTFEGKTGFIIGSVDFMGDIIVLVDNEYYEMERAFISNETINKKKLESEKEKWIGKSIWLGRVKTGDGVPLVKKQSIKLTYMNPYLNWTDKEKNVDFEDFQKVKVNDIVTYGGFYQKVILKISSDDGSTGYINSNNNDGFYQTNIAALGRFPIYYENNPIIDSWGEELIKKVKEQTVSIGMNKIQAKVSWGNPFEIYTSSNAIGQSESWYYGEYGEYGILVFVNGKLVQISGKK